MIKSFIIKFITSAIVLALSAFFTPNFQINTLTSLLTVALAITIINTLINLLLNNCKSNLLKKVVNFSIMILLLYSAQFLVSNYYISLPSAILGAIIYFIISSYFLASKSEKKASQDSTTSWLTKLRG